jgi:hypothetical protein
MAEVQRVATICDACGTRVEEYSPDGWVRFSSSHGDWGNDSCESFEYYDACSFDCYVALLCRALDDYGRPGPKPTLDVDGKDWYFLTGMVKQLRS